MEGKRTRVTSESYVAAQMRYLERWFNGVMVFNNKFLLTCHSKISKFLDNIRKESAITSNF